MNRENITAYSANDIARLIVRNPQEVTSYITYDRICDAYCHGTPLEELPESVQSVIFSRAAAADDLAYLGYNKKQISLFFQAYNEACQALDIESIKPDIEELKTTEKFKYAAYRLAAFPYGPPIDIGTPSTYNVMKQRNFSTALTNATLNVLQNNLAGKLMELWNQDRYILSILQDEPSTHPVPVAP